MNTQKNQTFRNKHLENQTFRNEHSEIRHSEINIQKIRHSEMNIQKNQTLSVQENPGQTRVLSGDKVTRSHHESLLKLFDVQAMLGEVTGVRNFKVVAIFIELDLVHPMSHTITCQVGLETPNVISILRKLRAETTVDVNWSS